MESPKKKLRSPSNKLLPALVPIAILLELNNTLVLVPPLTYDVKSVPSIPLAKMILEYN